MNILVSQLPSGGVGYNFPTITVNPMTFYEITKYLDNLPPEGDHLSKYLYDIKNLIDGDKNILNCYIMDVDFLIFYKKLITISEKLTYNLSVKCPHCGKELKKTISLEDDIRFKGIDAAVMGGTEIDLCGHKYETIIPTVNDFMGVFQNYLRSRKIEDLGLIKTISLIKSPYPNQVEDDVLNATHEDITLLLALKDIYFDSVNPIKLNCSCENDKRPEERRGVVVSVDSLITDFFREIYLHNPIDGSKILFKQIRQD
jgi:hypothetical protein